MREAGETIVELLLSLIKPCLERDERKMNQMTLFWRERFLEWGGVKMSNYQHYSVWFFRDKRRSFSCFVLFDRELT